MERCVGCGKEVTLAEDFLVEGMLMCETCMRAFFSKDSNNKNILEENKALPDKYTNFYKAIDEACEHMKKLIREKNSGYAQTGEGDPYCNFRWPDLPTVLAIYEGSKLSRLRGFVNNGGSKADAFEIFRDIAGYALIGMAWLKDEEGFEDGE